MDILKKKILRSSLFYLYCCSVMFLSCGEDTRPTVAKSTPVYIEPEYNSIKLTVQNDSLHFALNENTYNQIKSFNYFEHGGAAFISFYDRRSESINIYDFNSQRQIKKLQLKKIVKDKSFYKTSVFVKNFDTIFVANLWTLYLIDSTGTIKRSVNFFKRTDAMAIMDNNKPVVVKNNLVYLGVRPYVNETSLSDIRKWRVLYRINMQKGEKGLFYSLPEIYNFNLYDDRFFDYDYCYNGKGHFVLSFPADSNIYETDLSGYHNKYLGKSKFQKGPIKSINKNALDNDNGYKEFLARDSYGAIYYDSYRKRYLRIARRGIGEKEAYNDANKSKSKYCIIYFNENFQIIGESEIDDFFYVNSLFFTSKGNIYARVNASDEYAIHFIRLEYSDRSKERVGLTKR